MYKNIENIDFSNNNLNKINDFKIKRILLDYLCNEVNNIYLQEKVINEKNLLKNIKSKNYKAFYIPNSNNYILLLKEINNIYYSVLIKNNFDINTENINFNKLEIYHLNINFSQKYFNGTIINCFLKKNSENCILDVYDIIYNEGKIIEDNLDNKFKLLKNIINNFDTKYFEYNLVDILEIKDLKNTNDIKGIIFMPYINDLKYIIKKKEKIVKEYSILFMSKINTDVFNLFCLENSKKKKIGIAHIPNINTSKIFNKYDEEIIVKCWLNTKFNKWVPYEILENNENISTLNEINIKIKKI